MGANTYSYVSIHTYISLSLYYILFLSFINSIAPLALLFPTHGVDFTFGGLSAPGGGGGPVYGGAYMFIFEFIIKIPNQIASSPPAN